MSTTKIFADDLLKIERMLINDRREISRLKREVKTNIHNSYQKDEVIDEINDIEATLNAICEEVVRAKYKIIENN